MMQTNARAFKLAGMMSLGLLLAACAQGGGGSAGGGAPSGGSTPTLTNTAQAGSGKLAYKAPGAAPMQAQSDLVPGRQRPLLRSIRDMLKQEGFKITSFNPDQGMLQAKLDTRPDEFVDCGWVGGSLVKEQGGMPAASPRINTRVDRAEGFRVSQRRLDGEAMLTVTTEWVSSEETRVNSNAYFVLLKWEMNGDGDPLNQEVIYFGSGESAKFSRGTQCQSNGRLETLVSNFAST